MGKVFYSEATSLDVPTFLSLKISTSQTPLLPWDIFWYNFAWSNSIIYFNFLHSIWGSPVWKWSVDMINHHWWYNIRFTYNQLNFTFYHSSLWSWREVGNKREILFLIRLLKVGESGTNNAKVGGKDQIGSRQQKTGRFACKFCRLINKDIIPADGILLYCKQLDNKELNSVTK